MKRILFILLLCWSASAVAQKGTIDVSIDPKRAFVGEPLHLTINLGLGGNLQSVEVPTLEGLDVIAGQWPPSSPSVFIRGGFFKVPLADVYLTATKPGNLVFGKVKITVDGETIESAPITIEALERPNTPSSAPSSQAADRLDNPLYGLPEAPTDSLVLHAVTDRDEVFLGGSVNASYWLLVRPGVRLSNLNIQKPETNNAIIRSVVDFENNNFTKKEVLWGGNVYTAILLGRTAFIPIKEGALEISPMVISVVSGGGFGREIELPSGALSLQVKPLPEGRPNAQAAIVGEFQMTLSSPVTEAISGEAFPVSLVVSGAGDLSGYEPSAFTTLKDARIRPPAIKRDDSIDKQSVLLSRVEAQYFIVPEKPGALQLEAPTLAVFSPETKKWTTITAPPIEIKVKGTATGSAALLQLRTSRDTLQGQQKLVPSLLEVIAMFVGPLFFLLAVLRVDTILSKRSASKRPFISAHQALESASNAKNIIGVYAEITRMIVSASEAKTQMTLHGKTWRELSKILSEKTNQELGARALALLERADQIRYAPGNEDTEKSKAIQEARTLLQSLEDK